MRINISNLKKTFGDKTAVSIPDFTINDGDMLGLVGNNGAGKTTLFRLMLDLIKADEGTVTMSIKSQDGTYEEINPAESEDWKVSTGAYIDEGFLIDFLTPEEYFRFIGKVNGLSEQETNERVSSFEHFMGGEILLDEPFNFLDPTSQNSLKHILEDYNTQSGATILISSHNLTHTVDISSRIVLLEKGVIIKDLPNKNNCAEKELEDYFNIGE